MIVKNRTETIQNKVFGSSLNFVVARCSFAFALGTSRKRVYGQGIGLSAESFSFSTSHLLTRA